MSDQAQTQSVSLKKYSDLFVWDADKIEDIQFWCHPRLTSHALQEIPKLFNLADVDGFCALEARGFLLSGMAAAIFNKPVMLLRKHKKFYDRMDHARVDFTNWKHEPETLVLLKKSNPALKRVLLIDDILDSGASLKAAQRLLEQNEITLVGAFYLLNASKSDLSKSFGIPVEAAVTHQLF